MSNMLDKAKSIEDYIIAFRRDLHENPELSGEEYETQKKLMKELDALGIPYKKAGNTSLIATLKGGRSGKTVALRGDIDACFGMHNLPQVDVGYIDITLGYRSAGCDTIYVKFEGVSGHGSGNKEKDCIYFPHHEKFKVDEDCLKYGTAFYAQFTLDYLNS